MKLPGSMKMVELIQSEFKKKITLAVEWRIDCKRDKVEKETSLNTIRIVWVRGDGCLDYRSKSRVDKKK